MYKNFTEFGYDIAKSFWNWYNFFPRNDGINKYIRYVLKLSSAIPLWQHYKVCTNRSGSCKHHADDAALRFCESNTRQSAFHEDNTFERPRILLQLNDIGMQDFDRFHLRAFVFF